MILASIIQTSYQNIYVLLILDVYYVIADFNRWCFNFSFDDESKREFTNGTERMLFEL